MFTTSGLCWTYPVVEAGAYIKKVTISHLLGNSKPNLHCFLNLIHVTPGIRNLFMVVTIGKEGTRRQGQQ